MSLRSLGIGTYVQPSPDHPDNPYYPIKTATLETPVFDIVHMFSKDGISAVPIIAEDGTVLNLYETVDVIVSCFTPLLILLLTILSLRPLSDLVHTNPSTSQSRLPLPRGRRISRGLSPAPLKTRLPR